MIEFFTENEALINLATMVTMLIALYIASKREEDDTLSIAVLSVGFFTMLLSILINGIIKGF